MKKLLFQSGVLLLLLTLMSTGHAQNERYIPVFCNQGHSIQDALDRATEGALVDIWGTCNDEAVVIETDGLTISAISGQTTNINPPAGGVAFTVRADNVEISNLNITGGSSAVVILGSNATITNNQISNYTFAGILIAGSASGSIQYNSLSSTFVELAAIFVVGNAFGLIENNTIGASSASGILISSASSSLLNCNDISVSHPFFAGIHVTQTSQVTLSACPNTVSNSDSAGSAIFCSQNSAIFVEVDQFTTDAINLHPNCEVGAIPSVTFPPLPLSKTLVVVIDFTNVIFNAGSTNTLAKGVRTYQEFPLLDAQGALIGEYRFHAVSTLPMGLGAAWYGNESFDIFGEGVIEGISQADMSVTLFPDVSIIGGTGRFSGASGEYTASNFSTYTFTFRIAR